MGKKKPGQGQQQRREDTGQVSFGGMTEISAGIRNDRDVKTDPDALRQGTVDDKDKPYCHVHNVLMRVVKSPKTHAVYKCPVRGCKSDSEKKIKPDVPAPKDPLYCPLCKKVCVVDITRSDSLILKMVCSDKNPDGCNYEIDVQRPDAAKRMGASQISASIMDDR